MSLEKTRKETQHQTGTTAIQTTIRGRIHLQYTTPQPGNSCKKNKNQSKGRQQGKHAHTHLARTLRKPRPEKNQNRNHHIQKCHKNQRRKNKHIYDAHARKSQPSKIICGSNKKLQNHTNKTIRNKKPLRKKIATTILQHALPKIKSPEITFKDPGDDIWKEERKKRIGNLTDQQLRKDPHSRPDESILRIPPYKTTPE